MGERILVTGGAGFIGSHLVDALLENGDEVCTVDNFDPFYPIIFKQRNISRHQKSRRFTLEKTDIRDIEGLNRIFDYFKPEVVVHLAAKAGVRPSLISPLEYLDVNILGTLNMLNNATKYGVRKFIFGSSSSVYGLNTKVPFHEEDATLLPASPYAASKIAGEALCKSFSHCYGLRVTVLRFFTVYGPRQRPDLAISKFVQRMMDDLSIPIFGNGLSSRDYTFVIDVVNGIQAAIDYEDNEYEVFNIGNDHPVSLQHLVELIETTLNKQAKVERLPEQIGDVPHTWADIKKANRLLNYQPKISLNTGLQIFANWLIEQEQGVVE